MNPLKTLVAVLVIPTCMGISAQQDTPKPPKEPTVQTSTAPQTRPANRLKDATSPYLLQHAHNPVDWYPWGKEAFARAKAEDKPIFLSVGYSACHWCHVMAHECFENEALAKLLNQYFVAIKVDREERPDIDDLYMRYVHLTGQGGGWPMSIFMTPDAEPFFSGTYFPPASFAKVLTSLHDAWTGQREKVNQAAHEAVEGLRQHARIEYRDPEHPLSRETASRAVEMLDQNFDWDHGGLQAPRKFPPHTMLEWLLDRVERTAGDTPERRMVKRTLDRMQLGGIHDHIGGGFHRYATDREWFLPHFEKMLYDNAQLGRVYARAAGALDDPAYAATARGIYEWVLRDMTSPDGAFFSSLDADSEGVEGRYYVWSAAEVRAVLGPDATAFERLYNVSEKGNYHEEASGEATERNIPFLSKPLTVAQRGPAEKWRHALLEVRNRRVRPHLDDKVLSGWNALMIGSLADGGRLLREPRYTAAAERAASWLLEHLRRKDGRWQASYRAGRVSGDATLDDYAYLASAFLDLHTATNEKKWKNLAVETVELIERHFRDKEGGGYYLVADDHEKLLARVINPTDNATPSGNGILAQVLVRLAFETGEAGYRKRAGDLFRTFHTLLDVAPVQVESLLKAFDRSMQAGWESLAADTSKVRRGSVTAELLPGQDRLLRGQRVPVAVRLTMAEGGYVQGAEGAEGVTFPTVLRVVSTDLGELADVRYPPAGKQALPEAGSVDAYAGELVLSGWLSVPATAPTGRQSLRIEVAFQACRTGACEPPQTVTLALTIDVSEKGVEAKPLNAKLFSGLHHP